MFGSYDCHGRCVFVQGELGVAISLGWRGDVGADLE